MARTNKEVSKPEGWALLANGRSWHYFQADVSLCEHRLKAPAGQLYVTGGDDSPDNCLGCRRRRAKELKRS